MIASAVARSVWSEITPTMSGDERGEGAHDRPDARGPAAQLRRHHVGHERLARRDRDREAQRPEEHQHRGHRERVAEDPGQQEHARQHRGDRADVHACVDDASSEQPVGERAAADDAERRAASDHRCERARLRRRQVMATLEELDPHAPSAPSRKLEIVSDITPNHIDLIFASSRMTSPQLALA